MVLELVGVTLGAILVFVSATVGIVLINLSRMTPEELKKLDEEANGKSK